MTTKDPLAVGHEKAKLALDNDPRYGELTDASDYLKTLGQAAAAEFKEAGIPTNKTVKDDGDKIDAWLVAIGDNLNVTYRVLLTETGRFFRVDGFPFQKMEEMQSGRLGQMLYDYKQEVVTLPHRVTPGNDPYGPHRTQDLATVVALTIEIAKEDAAKDSPAAAAGKEKAPAE